MMSADHSFGASSREPEDIDDAVIESLEELLSIEQTVLASLLEPSLADKPGIPGRIEESRRVILDFQRKIREARRGRLIKSYTTGPTANIGNPTGTDPLRSCRDSTGEFSMHTPSDGTNPGYTNPAWGSSVPQKRTFGSAYLSAPVADTKSRRTTPSPMRTSVTSPSSGSGFDMDDESIIDLTGDGEEWRNRVRVQKEQEDWFKQMKEQLDRDAQLARKIQEGRYSNELQDGSLSTLDRMLHPGQPDHTNGSCNHASAGAGPSSLSTTLGADIKSSSNYRMPGTYESDDDDVSVTLRGSASRSPRQTLGQWKALAIPPSPLSFGSPQTSKFPPGELARRAALARQQGRPEGQSSGHDNFADTWSYFPSPTVSRDSRPGMLINGRYCPRPTPPAYSLSQTVYGGDNATKQRHENNGVLLGDLEILEDLSTPSFFSSGSIAGPSNGFSFGQGNPFLKSEADSMGSLIRQTNGIDWDNLTDAYGNALNPRLASFYDDTVNDPRKSSEEIQQLLANIRPDEEIPEEERGQTPDALKYPLYVHQQLALKWMGSMEEGTNKGGILADDMGLGKTITTIAVMTTRQGPSACKTNLIIGPVALIRQWEQEIQDKVRRSHKLTVYLLHGKKAKYSDLLQYDVVLTTYGSVASEWKKFNRHTSERQDSSAYNAGEDAELQLKCPLLHPKSKFYRVILDEAQIIKNRETQGSKGTHQIKATYRWCLTGTPMMNGVHELYPLIRFLDIRPYTDWREFNYTFGCLSPKGKSNATIRTTAMRKLQTLLKAIMLRRMKNSVIDGKPILSLPEKTINKEEVQFSQDEASFYQALESRAQVTFNKYVRTGTVGKHYSNILVLLLRLRQACCHPHLMDFEIGNSSNANAEVTEDLMMALTKELKDSVVERIKQAVAERSAENAGEESTAFDCPICLDATDNPTFVIPCGHETCSECFASLTANAAQNDLRNGNEAGSAKCPQCRGPVNPTRVINFLTFRKAFMPETLPVTAAPAADEVEEYSSDDSESSAEGDASETNSEVGSDEQHDLDTRGNLRGFVVDDEKDDGTPIHHQDDDGTCLSRMSQAVDRRPTKHKGKRSKKSKGKKKYEFKPAQLADLRKDANKNMLARRKYMHYLRDNWEDSAKVTRVVELLRKIQETDEKTIIFSQWTTLLDLIEVQVKYELGLKLCRYTGSMTPRQRDDAVTDFKKNPDCKVLLVSIKAGNAGLNLVAASRVIICDPSWNPYVEMQAVDRAHRIGQQRPVQVHRVLTTGTVEDRIMDLQERKRELVDVALDEGESKNLGRLSQRELGYLFGVSDRSQF